MRGISSQSGALSVDFKIETRKARVCRPESGKSSGSRSRVLMELSHDSGSTAQRLSSDAGFIAKAVGLLSSCGGSGVFTANSETLFWRVRYRTNSKTERCLRINKSHR